MYLFLTVEIWKELPWYNWKYLVSNFWNIYSKKIKRNLSQYTQSRWYFAVTLKIKGKNIWSTIHRLMMIAFYKKSKLTVNHINWNKKCNFLWNLEYCTLSENLSHYINNFKFNNGANDYSFEYKWTKWIAKTISDIWKKLNLSQSYVYSQKGKKNLNIMLIDNSKNESGG